MLRVGMVMGIATLLAGSAFAGEIDQKAVYASDASMCVGDTSEAADDLGGMTLSFPEGISANEYHCDFFEIRGGHPYGWLLVDAICEEPGFRYPTQLAISEANDTQIEVVNGFDTVFFKGEDSEGSPGTTYFTRCDQGVKPFEQ